MAGGNPLSPRHVGACLPQAGRIPVVFRVKGVKKLGVRFGNWLTAEQGHAPWQAPDHQRLKEKRDRALLALLLACGLRRHEAVALRLDHLQ